MEQDTLAKLTISATNKWYDTNYNLLNELGNHESLLLLVNWLIKILIG